MTRANPPLSAGELARGSLLTATLVACDLLIKVLATAGCGGGRGVSLGRVWELPTACSGIAIAGSNVTLALAERTGWMFGLPEIPGPLWGVVGLAVGVIVTMLVLRWRWRSAGDAFALGALWGGLLSDAIPRFVLGGPTRTELELFGYPTGLAELSVAWAAIWMLWRFVAEARA